MRKDVLIQRINSETRSTIISVVDQPTGVFSSENVLLSLRELPISKGFIVVTNAGWQRREILLAAAKDFKFGRRSHLKSGDEGSVWVINSTDSLVIKEQTEDKYDKSPYERLITMEALRHIVGQTPGLEYVRVPEQYGFITMLNTSDDRTTWFAMQYAPGIKINHISHESKPEILYRRGLDLPEVKSAIDNAIILIMDTFAKIVVSSSSNIRPDDLYDNNVPQHLQTNRNFLIDLNTPAGDKPYTVWVVDQ